MNMELYIEPKRLSRSPINGRFLKGAKPHTFGKKWGDWMSAEAIAKKKSENLINLKKYDHSTCGGHNAKMIVGVKNGRFAGVFKGSNAASEYGKCDPGLIRNVCRGNRKTAGGIHWFWESDFDKWNALITIKNY